MKRLVPLLLVLAALAGCATPATPPPPPALLATLFDDAAFAPPSVAVDASTLFTLSPAMRDYLHSPAFKALLRTRGPEQGLVDALYSKHDLQIEYDASVTRTAAETYAARAGNCLSLVIMTAAFARELDMTVRYQSVDIEDTWSRDGSLYLVAAHVNIALGHRKPRDTLFDDGADRALVIDFIPPPAAARLRTRQLDEAALVALFLNNRAAEHLVQGHIDDAYWWARAAVSANPASAPAYNTLAVTYQRHGQLALAERVYRVALERDPDNLVTLQNLGPLLAQLGRAGEAQAIAQHVARIQPVPPFQYFDQGVAAMARGDYENARGLFEREVRRAPDNDEFHYWLALALLRLGDDARARDQLARAMDTSSRRDMRDAYSAKLAHLRQYR